MDLIYVVAEACNRACCVSCLLPASLSAVFYNHYIAMSVTVSSTEALDIRNTFYQDGISLIVGLPNRRAAGVFVTVSVSKQLCSWQLDFCTWRCILP